MGICSLFAARRGQNDQVRLPIGGGGGLWRWGGWGIFTALVLFQVPLPNSPCQTKNAPKRERHFGFIAA